MAKKKTEKNKPVTPQAETPSAGRDNLPVDITGLTLMRALLNEQAQRIQLEFQLNRQTLAEVEKRLVALSKKEQTKYGPN